MMETVDAAAEAAEQARLLIAGGYLSLADVAEAIVDMQEYEDEDEDGDGGGEGEAQGLDLAEIDRIAEAAWRERLAEQALWPERTDPDALEAAFDELDARGIVALENFTCCSSCARSEVGAELEPDSRGYVFFHSQATDNAVRTGELYLYYGACEPHSVQDVAREIVGRLEDEGLPVVWDGSTDTAIRVTPIVWRKRIARLG